MVEQQRPTLKMGSPDMISVPLVGVVGYREALQGKGPVRLCKGTYDVGTVDR